MIYEYEGVEYEFPDGMSDDEVLRLIRLDREDTRPQVSYAPADSTSVAAPVQAPTGGSTPPATGTQTKEERRAIAQAKYNAGQVKPGLSTAMAPRTSSLPDDASRIRRGAAVAADYLSLPGRAIAALAAFAPGGETYQESLARTQGKTRPGVVGYAMETAGNIIRDPALPVSAVTGGPIATGIKGLGAAGLLGKAAIGAAQAVPVAATHQMERVAAGQNISPFGAAAEIAAGWVAPIVAAGVGKGVKKLSDVAYRFLRNAASGFTKVSEEALETASTKTGRAALKNAAGTEVQIANELLDFIDNAEDYMPEAKMVDKIVDELPAIDTDNVKKVLESSIQPPATPSAESANRVIQKLVGYLDKNSTLTAKEFRKLRIMYDREAAAAFNKDYRTYIEQAIIRARKQMADDLVQKAYETGRPEYADIMERYASKMKTIDQLKGLLGSGGETRARRVEGFVDNLFGKNKSYAQKLLAGVEEITGADILKPARTAQLASEFGPTGMPGWQSMHQTGKANYSLAASLLAGLGGMAASGGNPSGLAAALPVAALGSPKAVTSVVLPAARAAGRAGEALARSTPPAALTTNIAREVVEPEETEEERRKRFSLLDGARGLR